MGRPRQRIPVRVLAMSSLPSKHSVGHRFGWSAHVHAYSWKAGKIPHRKALGRSVWWESHQPATMALSTQDPYVSRPKGSGISTSCEIALSISIVLVFVIVAAPLTRHVVSNAVIDNIIQFILCFGSFSEYCFVWLLARYCVSSFDFCCRMSVRLLMGRQI